MPIITDRKDCDVIHRVIDLGPGVQLTTYIQEPASAKYDTSFSGDKKPAVLILPGGSYLYVSEREGEPVALHYLKEGFAAFVLSYRCGKDSAYPAPIEDVCRALEHMRSEADSYGIDPEKIALVGFSAGAHLAALMGGIYKEPIIRELGFEQVRPRALILAYPVLHISERTMERFKGYSFKEMLGDFMNTFDVRTSPYHQLHREYPDTFLFLTQDDELIDPSDSLSFVTKALTLGVSMEVHLFDEGAHALATADHLSCSDREFPKRLGAWMELSIDWLKQKIK